MAYPVVEFFMEGFGPWAKQKRNARRWTLEYLGELVGTTPAAISRYESGARQANRETILLIADALAGPDADEDEREALRNEALRASVGIEAQEIERSILMERFGGRYDGIAQYDDLVELAESTMETLLRQAQKRQAIGGTGEAPKSEEPKK